MEDTEATLANLEHQARISADLYQAVLAAIEAGWSPDDLRDDIIEAVRTEWPQGDVQVSR